MVDRNPTKPITTLDLNDIDMQIKRQRLANWIQNKPKPNSVLSTGAH